MLWIVFRLGRLRRQKCIDAAVCKAAEVAADRPARHLKTSSNDGYTDSPKASREQLGLSCAPAIGPF